MAAPRTLNNNETLIAPDTEIQSNQPGAVTNTARANEKMTGLGRAPFLAGAEGRALGGAAGQHRHGARSGWPG
jgi:hypothetical protein